MMNSSARIPDRRESQAPECCQLKPASLRFSLATQSIQRRRPPNRAIEPSRSTEGTIRSDLRYRSFAVASVCRGMPPANASDRP